MLPMKTPTFRTPRALSLGLQRYVTKSDTEQFVQLQKLVGLGLFQTILKIHLEKRNKLCVVKSSIGVGVRSDSNYHKHFCMKISRLSEQLCTRGNPPDTSNYRICCRLHHANNHYILTDRKTDDYNCLNVHMTIIHPHENRTSEENNAILSKS